MSWYFYDLNSVSPIHRPTLINQRKPSIHILIVWNAFLFQDSEGANTTLGYRYYDRILTCRLTYTTCTLDTRYLPYSHSKSYFPRCGGCRLLSPRKTLWEFLNVQKLGFGYAYILCNREGSKAPDFTLWCCTDPRINKSSLVKETTVNNKQIRPASHFLPFDSGI